MSPYRETWRHVITRLRKHHVGIAVPPALRSSLFALRPSTEPYEYFGCGWHQSSYELACGDPVEEGLSFEEFELWVTVAEEQAAAAKGSALQLQAQMDMQP